MTNTDSIVVNYLKKNDPAAYIAALDKALDGNEWSPTPTDTFFGVDRTKGLEVGTKFKYGVNKDGSTRKKPGRPAR